MDRSFDNYVNKYNNYKCSYILSKSKNLINKKYSKLFKTE